MELKKKVVQGFDAEISHLSIKTGPSSIGAFCRERPGFEGLNPSKLQLSEFFSGRSSYVKATLDVANRPRSAKGRRRDRRQGDGRPYDGAVESGNRVY